ncbi:MAG TPA: hypothetical protein ENJ43_08245, partial [Gammaproteobacteria bacterium]|nr:hypothetical protein [Gammaproteobacteria bacterium]
MKNTKLKMLAALVSSSLLISGCGDSSSLNQLDTSNPGAPGSGNAENGNSGDENPFVGTSSISGAISLSSLSGSDANAVNGATAQFKQMSAANVRALDATSNAIVKLYVVGSNGELQDTGIDCSFDKQSDDNGNPRYSCPNVADGKQYVVKYLRLLEGNRALEMKVNVEVPEGAPSAEGGEISPESTVVVDTIINAILTATEGKNIDPEVVNDIVKSVKQAVINLVRSGAVQIPSMIVDAPKDASGNYISDVTRLKSGDDVDYGTNEQLQSAAGNLLSDESVANEVDAVKVEIGVRELERIDSSS